MAIKQLTPPEVRSALDADPRAVYLDVRTEGEFAEGHPAGAINIPVVLAGPGGMTPNPDFLAVAEKVLPRDRPVCCGCQAGARSQTAAEILARAGYADLTNVVGGFGGGRDASGRSVAGWKAAGLPVSRDAGEDRAYAGLRKKAGL
jgi:rhodanese-related sulfurtransferase